MRSIRIVWVKMIMPNSFLSTNQLDQEQLQFYYFIKYKYTKILGLSLFFFCIVFRCQSLHYHILHPPRIIGFSNLSLQGIDSFCFIFNLSNLCFSLLMFSNSSFESISSIALSFRSSLTHRLQQIMIG